MATNFIQGEGRLTVTAPSTLTSGLGCLVGDIFGVSIGAYTTGASAVIETEGVWDLASTTTLAWSSGAKIYWDNAAGKATDIAKNNRRIGVATAAKAAAATVGRVRLDGDVGPLELQVVSSSGAQTTTAGASRVQLGPQTTVISATIADAANHQGQFTVFYGSTGTIAHTLTLTSGSFDGSNNVATLNAAGESLTVWFDSAGAGKIIANVGSVGLS